MKILRKAARRAFNVADAQGDSRIFGLCQCLIEGWAHPEILPDLTEEMKDLVEEIRDMGETPDDLARIKKDANRLAYRLIKLSLP